MTIVVIKSAVAFDDAFVAEYPVFRDEVLVETAAKHDDVMMGAQGNAFTTQSTDNDQTPLRA